MPENAVEFIDEVSNSPAANGKNQLLTAEAVQSIVSAGAVAGPQLWEFSNTQINSGFLVLTYDSGQPVVFYQMKDNDDNFIKIPATYDDAGQYITFDFRSLEDPNNPGQYIDGDWQLIVWTSTGPQGVEAAPIVAGDNFTGRVRLEPPTGDVDLKTIASHTVFVVETDTIFAPEELQVVLMDADTVTSEAFISLDVVAGDTIVASQILPITGQYERHSIDISGFDVLPAGSAIRFNVTTGAVAGTLIGRVFLFGYVDDIVL